MYKMLVLSPLKQKNTQFRKIDCMQYYNSLTEIIGNTPLVKLNKVARHIPATVLVKVEYFNPGHSVKDRIALKMIEDAEKEGKITPGGTIIEGTSGNTGMGLALVAIAKGYKCIFTTTDKQSPEKINALRALGAEVIICPTNVPADDEKSYYSVARKINKETPNSFYPNQYDNLSNTAAHYETTGPEIWKQTDGKITHYVAGVGTGGTICGTGKYLREQRSDVHIIGVDSYGSVFKKYKETGVFDEKEIYPYMTEGIGEDILPKNVDFSMIDEFVKVTDKDAALMTRKLAGEEGLFIGWSCGAAVHGALDYAERTGLKEDDVMVIILPDHGTRYLNKVYNDDWMKNHGFLENKFATAHDIIRDRSPRELITVDENATVSEAIAILRKEGISQLPVTNKGAMVGSITDQVVLRKLIDDPALKEQPVAKVMEVPFTVIALDSTLDVMSSLITQGHKALLVRDRSEKTHIITQADILSALN